MENMSEDDGWEFVNLGDQQSFGIKTAGLEEKATACQMLVRLGEGQCCSHANRTSFKHCLRIALDLESFPV
jgi:hypothetical protein